jgi:hypothetical protein
MQLFSDETERIDLRAPLSLRTAFRFPLQNSLARREVLIGAAWLLVPGIGWLLNMGHRIQVVHNMQTGKEAWPAWQNHSRLLWLGFVTFLGMVEYHLPATIVGAWAWHRHSIGLGGLSIGLWLLATLAIPGYMTHYCRHFDAREVFDPFRAMRRVLQGGPDYWRAWGIALSALVISFTGLLALGVGFLVTSVWFWQVAGYSFATVFTKKFDLS